MSSSSGRSKKQSSSSSSSSHPPLQPIKINTTAKPPQVSFDLEIFHDNEGRRKICSKWSGVY